MPTVEEKKGKWYKIRKGLYSNGTNAFVQEMENGEWHVYLNLDQTTMKDGTPITVVMPDFGAFAAKAKMAVADLRMQERA